jgi:hypothetical protein
MCLLNGERLLNFHFADDLGFTIELSCIFVEGTMRCIDNFAIATRAL